MNRQVKKVKKNNFSFKNKNKNINNTDKKDKYFIEKI